MNRLDDKRKVQGAVDREGLRVQDSPEVHSPRRDRILPEELCRQRTQINAERDPDIPKIETAPPPRLS